ncbi:DUF262 domain-containing protein [Nocardiopsis baichengensis]|uniref:DUF262 domain-containing protein n=1 Tax=Nocardiopsis baichengensis TaxID=280240 RepID=UPI001EF9F025|nr:DUF262 domain-containing protein [Nocardiopsis baichengensis]
MAPVTRPKIEEVRPGDLVQWARDGLIRLPAFQRSYQWERKDVRRLFDSLLRGYPIGNLLVWSHSAPAATVAVGDLTVDAPATGAAYWVVDGQQRITSLVGALTATDATVDPRFRIFYDLDSGEFRSLTRRSRPEDDWFPVPLALDTAKANAWLRERPHFTDGQIARADEFVAAIRDYKLPMYIVTGDDERTLREIFDRMNTYGKALKGADIFRALHASSGGESPGDLDSLGAAVARFGYGRFPDQLLTQSVLAIRDPRVDRDFRREFSDDDDLQAALHTTREVLGHVVDFLREEVGIPHIKLLPYALFVPVLARFVARFGPPKEHAAELLRRWVWRGSVLGVAPQGNTVGLRKNARAVRDDALGSARRLLGMLPAMSDSEWEPDLAQTRINSALGKVNILGLLSLGPLTLPGITDSSAPGGTPVDIAAALEQDPSLPLLAPIIDIPWPEGENIANRIVAPGGKAAQVREALLDIADRSTADGGERFRDRMFTGHALDEQCLSLLKGGRDCDAQAFLQYRSQLVRQTIAGNVQKHALFGFQDTPGLGDLFGDFDPPPVWNGEEE